MIITLLFCLTLKYGCEMCQTVVNYETVLKSGFFIQIIIIIMRHLQRLFGKELSVWKLELNSYKLVLLF